MEVSLYTKKSSTRAAFIIVRRMRLELTRSCDHYPLKVACIPISPPALSEKQRNTFFSGESSPAAAMFSKNSVPRTGLEPARLATYAPETYASTNSATWAYLRKSKQNKCSAHPSKESGKRDSNSRPRPWQGRALPTELLPHSLNHLLDLSSGVHR